MRSQLSELSERWRIPALCLVASLALHWLALDALWRKPAEIRFAAPATALRIAPPQYRAEARTSAAHAPIAEPVAELRAAIGSHPDSASAPIAAAPPAPVSQPAPRADIASGRPLDKAPPAVPTTRTEPRSAGAANRSAAGEHRGVVAAAPAERPDARSPSRQSAHAAPARSMPADDRGIRTTDQYRMALLFEAVRLRATTAYNGTGRAHVQLRFAIGGTLLDMRIAKSSGDPALDEAASELLTRAHARVPVPAVLWDQPFAVEATVSFEPRR
jgi:protein TonB